MPELKAYRAYLLNANWDRFKPLDPKLMDDADRALSQDIPALVTKAQYLAEHPEEINPTTEGKGAAGEDSKTKANWF